MILTKEEIELAEKKGLEDYRLHEQRDILGTF